MRRFALAGALAVVFPGLCGCVGEIAGDAGPVATPEAGLDFELKTASPFGPTEAPECYRFIDDEMAGDHTSMIAADTGLLAAPMPRTVFLNRAGGLYTAGREDSRSNSSSIAKGTVNMPAFGGSDAAWSELVSCVKDQFSRFDLTVTDVDPGRASHVEALISGRPSLVGLGPSVGGVAPFTRNCSVIENAVVYIFEQNLRTPQLLCEVTAHEVAHAFGLDHEFLCKDPMTYLSGCGRKAFQDQNVRCGEGSARDCACVNPFTGTRATQNSVQYLFQQLGPSGPGGGGGGGGGGGQPTGDRTAPQVQIAAPAPGAVLPANSTITIRAVATDDVGVTDVQLYWARNSLTVGCNNDTAGITCTRSGNSYSWSFAVGTGPRSFHVVARDAAGNVGQTPDHTIQLR